MPTNLMRHCCRPKATLTTITRYVPTYFANEVEKKLLHISVHTNIWKAERYLNPCPPVIVMCMTVCHTAVNIYVYLKIMK